MQIGKKFSKVSHAIIEKIDLLGLRTMFHQLEEEHSDMMLIFDSLIEGIVAMNSDDDIIFCNKAACALLGISLSETYEGTNIKDFIKNEEILDLIYQMKKKKDRINQEDFLFNQEEQQYLNFTLQPLVNEYKIVGNILIIKDITLEREVSSSEKYLTNMQNFKALTGGLAHEIKNPLGSLSIHIQLLQQEIKDLECSSTQREDISLSLNTINGEIIRLNKIVTDFLNSVRPQKAVLLPVNFHEYLNRVIDFIKPELESKNIKVEYEYTDLQLTVAIDENLFRQIIINLIENSIAAIIEANRDEGKIILSTSEKGGYLIFEIKDNGIGISQENTDKIFEPYFTTKSYGSGLGLMIVYKIIKEHMGDIKVASMEGIGTVFSMLLPLIGNENRLISYTPKEKKSSKG
jgi:PAS domain S-box-containing protein